MATPLRDSLAIFESTNPDPSKKTLETSLDRHGSDLIKTAPRDPSGADK
jgi:hypothetical protein